MDIVLSERHQPGHRAAHGPDAPPPRPAIPVKLVFGHVIELLDKDVDCVFLPSILDRDDPTPGQTRNHYCPYIPASPHMVAAHVDAEEKGVALRDLPLPHAADAGPPPGAPVLAAKLWACAPPRRGRCRPRRRGPGRVLAGHPPARGRCSSWTSRPDRPGVVLVGRPYNTCDLGVCLDLPRKLRKLGAVPIPIDCLPVRDGRHQPTSTPTCTGAAARTSSAPPASSRGTTGCRPSTSPASTAAPTPSSSSYFRRLMGAKPYLELEVDDHTAEAGIAHPVRGLPRQPPGAEGSGGMRPEALRTIYLPRMSDHALAIAAAMRAVGLDAEVLPEPNDASMAAGARRCAAAPSACPASCAPGDLLRKCREPGFDPRRAVFFMPTGPGPCRFGQYRVLQKSILEDQGFGGVEIVSPTTDDSYALFGDDPVRLRKLAWQAIVAVDLLTKVLHEHRPYEVVPSSSDEAYAASLDDTVRALEAGGGDPS